MPTKADYRLIGALILVSLVALAALHLTASDGAVAVVKEGDRVIVTLPLDTDTVYTLPHNTVTVQNGQVFVSAADCRDGICKAHAPTHTVGDTIVCLPNRVIVEVRHG